MELSKSPIPLYFQVEKKLREKVSNREIVREDGGLPSEEQLCQLFHASRITIRKALSELAFDGIITRKPGKGTFVLPQKTRIFSMRLIGSFDELVTHGIQTKMKLLNQKIIDAPSDVQDKLNLGDDKKVFFYEGLRQMGKKPYSFFSAYVPRSIGKFFTSADLKGKKTIFRLIEESTGNQILEADQSITASVVSKEIAKHLKMEIGTPLLLVQRIYFSQERKPLELSISYFRPDLYQYRIRLVGRKL